MAKNSDAKNLISILLAIFGFLALYTGFQAFQNSNNVLTQSVIISFIFAVVAFVIAYYISNQ